MDAKSQARQGRIQELFRELAELRVEEMADAGNFDQTPHFSVIERSASELAKQLSRKIQERASREGVARGQSQAICPTCGAICVVTTRCRTVMGVDGPFELTEAVADCRQCRRSFFPSADGDGVR